LGQRILSRDVLQALLAQAQLLGVAR
jgi:hypothetical protein